MSLSPHLKGHHVPQPLTDTTGASVAIKLDSSRPVSSYTAVLDARSPVGRAEFFDSPAAASERIFFHTEVDPAFGGRGLARLLVREALAGSVRAGVTVVPVCPLFGNHLKKHGVEFLAGGGRFRRPTRADIALVAQVTRGDG
ncbi:GNAT family N-acetyltransferase [Demequina sp. SO4-13]|uniref:GNAT family N-acetyltransferase n=1 Tax=Demequina sp. SO4-13 TaxID=3401027 RepID=UPI003AF8F0F6